MAKDAASELYEKISRDFDAMFSVDPIIRKLYKRIEDGKATLEEASTFAARAGEICSKALRRNLTEKVPTAGTYNVAERTERTVLHYNIAERTVKPSLERMHALIDDVCRQVQTAANEAAGVRIKAQPVPLDEERIEGITVAASSAETLEKANTILGEPVVNYALHVTDESVHRNADFQYRSGMSPKIIRTAMGQCCDWCASLEGTYDYEYVRRGSDVFRRHRYCRCVVTFESGRQRQNVWSKKTWEASPEELEQRQNFGLSDGREADKIEERKNIGLKDKKTAGQREIEFELLKNQSSDAICEAINKNHTALANYTPEQMKTMLEKMGYQTLPLGRGNFKGVNFEDGGGYRIHFGGDGILQYHPDAHSHHDGAYWKVGNGKLGTRRYRLDGTLKDD